MPIDRKKIHRAFLGAVLMNAAVGCADLIVGVLFITGSIGALVSISPHTAQNIQRIGSFYFFSHGIIKLLLSWNLIKGKLWAYPTAIVFFSVFAIYQIIDLTRHFSFFVFALFIVNAIVLYMVIVEYRRVRAALAHLPPQTS
ncbi:MAG TPA: DUF2127 domain-containing protein [Candidatus Paceibacterota bacterium]|nr:DUF2127 domain-containing protein [Candidatus Paceibacterota bacterium]